MVSGFVHPLENLKACQYKPQKIYYFDDIFKGTWDTESVVLAYSDVDIIRAGADFWLWVKINKIPVHVGKSAYLKELVKTICPEVVFDVEPIKKDHLVMNNFTDFIIRDNTKILFDPTHSVVERAAWVYDHVISFGNVDFQKIPPAN